MAGAAIIGAVGTVVGGAISADASRSAANKQADAQKQAAQLQYDEFQQQQAVQKPWVDAGQGALTQLEAGTAPGGQFNKPYTLADFQSGPQAGLYDFAKKQSLEAMQNQMGTGGQNLTTNAIAGAGNLAGNLANQYYNTGFNQNLATNNQALNSLQSLAGQGQTASNQVNANMGNLANNVGSTMINAGNAQAAGQVGQANAIGSAISSGANNASTMYTLSKIFGNSSGVTSGANTANTAMTSPQYASGSFGGSAYGGTDYFAP